MSNQPPESIEEAGEIFERTLFKMSFNMWVGFFKNAVITRYPGVKDKEMTTEQKRKFCDMMETGMNPLDAARKFLMEEFAFVEHLDVEQPNRSMKLMCQSVWSTHTQLKIINLFRALVEETGNRIHWETLDALYKDNMLCEPAAEAYLDKHYPQWRVSTSKSPFQGLIH